MLGTAARVLDRSPRHSELMSDRLVERRRLAYIFICVILKHKTSEVGSEPRLYVGRGHGRDFGNQLPNRLQARETPEPESRCAQLADHSGAWSPAPLGLGFTPFGVSRPPATCALLTDFPRGSIF